MVTFSAKKRLMRLLGLGLLLFLSCSPSLRAKEEKKSKAAEQSGSAFQVNVNLVSVNANVTDKQGLPISDLKEKDFQLLDNGAPQRISVFRVETIPGNASPVANKSLPAPTPPASATSSRKVILFFDDYHIRFEELVYVKKACKQFMETDLAPTDWAALITVSGQFPTEFTKSRE